MNRIEYVSSLFSGADQRDNFQHVAEATAPAAVMSPAPEPAPFPAGPAMTLPKTYSHQGTERDLKTFLDETETMALLVIRDGSIRHEWYAPWGGQTAPWVSMSVAKSFVSAALGIAVGDGLIGSIEEPVTAYIPELVGSAYDGVRIKDILQMSSGAGWNEDYSDPESDIMRLARVTIDDETGSFNQFTTTLKRARPPGSFNLYNSTDTQVLGWLLKRVTGRTIRDYMEEKLWHPLGMEQPGTWICDGEGMEMAFGGLNATARDYAKIGELYRLGGRWKGRQIVPEAWVAASVTPDAPHLMPGDTGLSDSLFGYGYQWWVPEGTEGEYSAIGVYNQFVYVNPTHGVVIAKLSASRRYGETNDETSYREYETMSMFRALVAASA
jgi:CubicO group peptidase (beta-lactamase class C family)